MSDGSPVRARQSCCRLCLAPGSECISILNSYAADKEPLATKIQNCVNIKINHDDQLSLRICHACISYLNSWQSFKNRCIASQTKQRSWLESNKRQQLLDNNVSISTISADGTTQSHHQQQHDDNEHQTPSLASSILDGITSLKKRKSLTVYVSPKENPQSTTTTTTITPTTTATVTSASTSKQQITAIDIAYDKKSQQQQQQQHQQFAQQQLLLQQQSPLIPYKKYSRQLTPATTNLIGAAGVEHLQTQLHTVATSPQTPWRRVRHYHRSQYQRQQQHHRQQKELQQHVQAEVEKYQRQQLLLEQQTLLAAQQQQQQQQGQQQMQLQHLQPHQEQQLQQLQQQQQPQQSSVVAVSTTAATITTTTTTCQSAAQQLRLFRRYTYNNVNVSETTFFHTNLHVYIYTYF